MFIAIVTFDGFNEIDSLVALHLFGRVRNPEWRVAIASNAARVTSMNRLTVDAQASLLEASDADVVLLGSGTNTLRIADDAQVMSQLRFDPQRQLIASQCSGALLLAKLGLLKDVPACTDSRTKPWVEKAGIEVLNQPFHARSNVATAGGCLASVYLASWIIARTAGVQVVRDALSYVAPVGEKEAYISHAISVIEPFIKTDAGMLA